MDHHSRARQSDTVHLLSLPILVVVMFSKGNDQPSVDIRIIMQVLNAPPSRTIGIMVHVLAILTLLWAFVPGLGEWQFNGALLPSGLFLFWLAVVGILFGSGWAAVIRRVPFCHSGRCRQ